MTTKVDHFVWTVKSHYYGDLTDSTIKLFTSQAEAAKLAFYLNAELEDDGLADAGFAYVEQMPVY